MKKTQDCKTLAIVVILVSFCCSCSRSTVCENQQSANSNIVNVEPATDSEKAFSTQKTFLSLQYILAHHEMFFTSNTTIELLPGEHVVNTSFDGILIVGIETLQ